MRIAILGTGRVARTLAAGLVRAAVTDSSSARRDPANRSGLAAPVVASADAVVGAAVVLNAVQGVDTIPLLTSIGADNLDGTVLWDIANATNPDFSLAIPEDSLGHRIQEAFPGVKSSRQLTTSPPSSSPTRTHCPLRRRCSFPATTPVPRRSSPVCSSISAGRPRACSISAASPTPTGRSTTLRCSERSCRNSARPTSTSRSSRPPNRD